jgi:aryl-alcohol dehydrogenase-like predicted oxidoreductase
MKSHHLDDAVSAVDLRLDDTEIAALEKAHRPHEVVGFR